MDLELRVQIYPGGCPGTDVHPVSVGCQQVVEEHGRTLGRCRCGSFGGEWPRPPPPSACNWPTAVRRAAISPFFSSKQPMSSSVRPSKAALEQNPSSPRALATALGSPHSDKNAPKSNRLAMLAISLALRRVPDSLPACPFTRFLRLLTETTGPYRPSHPLLATTPHPPLPPSRFLSSGHPGTSVLSCPPPPSPSLPPNRGHLVFKLMFT